MAHRSVAWAAAAALAVACGEPPVPGEVRDAEPYTPTATIEDIMRYMVDPAADAVWESVVTDVTADGVVEHVPETEEEWEALRGHAITLVESTNLLLMPRPVAAPGSRSEMPGVDLEPGEIEALLVANRAAWNAFVTALHGSGLEVLAAVEARDADALLVAGDGLDLACENCHLRYWYPSLAETDTAR